MPGVAGSGHAYADFLLGLPDTARRASPALLTEPQNRFLGLFVTDNWKATQRLTLDIGVRWDLMPPQTELNSRLAVFDPGRGAVVVPDKALPLLSPLLPRDYVPFVKASEAGLPQTLIRSDRNNVAPRFGFAWRPGSGTKTVIRGGYGIYFTAGSISTNKANTSPFVLAEPSFINTRPNPTLQLPQVFPAGGPSSGLTSVTLPAAVNPDLKVSYTQQVSFTVEREFLGMALRTSYIGTLGRQRLYSWNLNSPPIDDRLFVDKQRPFPKYPAISYTDNGANYNYNALNVELNRKFSNGLYYKFGWTWARDVGDFSTDNAGLENPFDRARDRGPHTATTTHRATLAYVYDLPFGRGQRWMSSAPKAAGSRRGWLAPVGRRLSSDGALSDAADPGARPDRHVLHHRPEPSEHQHPAGLPAQHQSRLAHHGALVRRHLLRGSAGGAFRQQRRGRAHRPQPNALAHGHVQVRPLLRKRAHAETPAGRADHQYPQPHQLRRPEHPTGGPVRGHHQRHRRIRRCAR